MSLSDILPPPPRSSAGPAPLRRPGSVRRTSSIDVSWPDGQVGPAQFVGRARDIVTPAGGGAPIICAEDSFAATLQPDRTILAIEADPPRPGLAQLAGERGGGGLRKILQEALPEEHQRATPLYLILDDISGTSLVSSWAWVNWDPDWMARIREALKVSDPMEILKSRVGVCVGLAEGSSGFDPEADRGGASVPDLRHADDPEGWHAFPSANGPTMRRARRIDVWRDDVLVIDTAFQDSANMPAGGRAAVHEYSLVVTADPVSLNILSIEATPRVLPHSECPAAAANMPRLLGTSLAELRNKVAVELKGTAGCTHLNDALRALSDVPALLRYLEKADQPA